jgi:heat-inducible transcriptional repressor
MSRPGGCPTQQGLRLFVDGFLEMGDIRSAGPTARIDATLGANDQDVEGALLDHVGDGAVGA